jgi:hypothetical protein
MSTPRRDRDHQEAMRIVMAYGAEQAESANQASGGTLCYAPGWCVAHSQSPLQGGSTR